MPAHKTPRPSQARARPSLAAVRTATRTPKAATIRTRLPSRDRRRALSLLKRRHLQNQISNSPPITVQRKAGTGRQRRVLRRIQLNPGGSLRLLTDRLWELRGDQPGISRCGPLIRERQPGNAQPTPVLIHLLAATRAVSLRRDPRPRAQPGTAEIDFRRPRAAPLTRTEPNGQQALPCFAVRRTLDHVTTEAVKVRGPLCSVDRPTANLATVPRMQGPPARLSSKEALASHSPATKATL